MEEDMAVDLQTAIFDAWSKGYVGDEVVRYVLSLNPCASETEVLKIYEDMFHTMKD